MIHLISISFLGVEHVFVGQKEEKWDFVERSAEDVDEKRKRKAQREQKGL